MMKKYFLLMTLGIWLATSIHTKAQPLTVKVNQPVADIQPTMWGIFFEDINFAADGGIYAELVKNRSFEFFKPLMGWNEQKKNDTCGNVLILNRAGENPSNPRFARITANCIDESYSLINEGFRGMGIKKDNLYHFSVLARLSGGEPLKIIIRLIGSNGQNIGENHFEVSDTTWKKYKVDFSSSETDPKAKLALIYEGKGSVDMDMVSLFPDDTWKHRPNGLRADLVQLLADMKPGFLRFPGGCIVEGRELNTRYQWKKTIGNIDEREMIVNRWNTEFSHRLTPDYFQTFGLGFYEYFQLAEDIGAEPLPILNCGMACQFNTAEVVPMNELDPYIQDALDLVEFANGPVDSKWGKIRANMGHPEPFHLKYLGIGNEQWGPQYIDRYKAFVKVLKDRHPEITLVTGTGPNPDGELFDYAAKQLKALNAEIVDEHYYRSPEWFFSNATRYDQYDRNSYKIFAGEYAAQSVGIASPNNKNNWLCALSEAAFMTGLERNAAVVHMCSYAPLFANINGWQWTPDLIWFDNLRSFGTPNYYVQKLYANNKGTNVLPIVLNDKPITGIDSLYATAALDKPVNQVILKIVNASSKPVQKEIMLEGIKKAGNQAVQTTLESSNLNAVNSLDNPLNISPKEKTVTVKGKKLSLSLDPYSLNIVRINL